MFQKQKGRYRLLVGAIILLVLGIIDIVVLNLWIVSPDCSSLECEPIPVAKQPPRNCVDTNRIEKVSNGHLSLSQIVVEKPGKEVDKETAETQRKNSVSSTECSCTEQEKDISLEIPKLSPSLPEDVIISFDKNQHSLAPQSIRILEKKVIAVLKRYPATRIRIEGHTDQKGPEHYNYRLSQCRVAMVVSFLMKHGIALERIESQSYGSSYPLNQQNTAKNRRVALRIIGKY